MLGAIDETTEFSSAGEKAAELEPGFCHRMLEFQIEYPRGSGFACGRNEEAGCATVRMSGLALGRPWRHYALLKR